MSCTIRFYNQALMEEWVALSDSIDEFIAMFLKKLIICYDKIHFLILLKNILKYF